MKNTLKSPKKNTDVQEGYDSFDETMASLRNNIATQILERNLRLVTNLVNKSEKNKNKTIKQFSQEMSLNLLLTSYCEVIEHMELLDSVPAHNEALRKNATLQRWT